MACPASIPKIEETLQSILHESRLEIALDMRTNRDSRTLDVFNGLTPELLKRILLRLDIASIHDLRFSSRRVAQITSDKQYWKKRISMDMPWIAEFLTSLIETTPDGMD